jgi:HlyD family secretion protein
LRIPTSALLEGGKVLLLGQDGVLQERRIQSGLSNWEFTEVSGGLSEGEQVVTSLDRAGVKAGVRAWVEPAPAKP